MVLRFLEISIGFLPVGIRTVVNPIASGTGSGTTAWSYSYVLIHPVFSFHCTASNCICTFRHKT